MCNEADNAIKSGTANGIKISYNTIVQCDNDIYSVKKGTWWNLSNAVEFENSYYDTTKSFENLYIQIAVAGILINKSIFLVDFRKKRQYTRFHLFCDA